jgi:transcriptional regulator with XRE-family HTH domain
MPEPAGDDLARLIGERVERQRRRRGLSRSQLSQLVNRTERWMGFLEQEGRGALRLDNLIDLARAMRIDDLSALVGRRFTATALEVPEHPAVSEIRHALTHSLLDQVSDAQRCSPAHLEFRIRHAWEAWHVSRTQNTQLGLLLPDLLRDTTALTRATTGARRRMAYAIATRVYLIGQRFAYGVRALNLAVQFTDRALLAADMSDDPRLMALAGWGSAMTSLTAQEPLEAEQTALAALRHVARPASTSDASVRGALLLFAAMGAASDRRTVDAWHHWEEAERVATEIGRHVDVETMFSAVNVGIYAVAVNMECGRTSNAVTSAADLDPKRMPSSNRRATHFIDLARTYDKAGDRDAARRALLDSVEASTETIVFNPDGRRLVASLARAGVAPNDELVNLADILGLL